MRYGPAGAAAAVIASVPSTDAMKARNSFASSRWSVVAAMYAPAGIHSVIPLVSASGPGWAKKPMSCAFSGIERRQGRQVRT